MRSSPLPSRPSAGAETVSLDFYGVTARVSSSSAESLDEFRRDFAWFLSARADGAAQVELELVREAPPAPAGPPVEDRGPVRTVRHGAEALVVHDFSSERGSVVSADPHLLHELGYILLLSRVGMKLDRRGLHRAHGLGFSLGGRAALALFPVGGGKTTLALELLKRPDVRLLSEDTPLVDRRGRLWPFPVRFGVSAGRPLPDVPADRQRLFRRRRWGDKILIDVSHAEGRWADRAAHEPDVLLLAGGFAAEGALARRSALAAVVPLFLFLVVGVGVPQGKEYLLRPRLGALLDLLRAGFSRLAAAAALWRRCRAYRAALGPSAAANVDMVRSALA